mmetsp:Transcript_71933/g.164962  ORF Transcript_71933/g.164962 Transcript_71933/m.164962 type:complete len:272 (+) Transcript_71933:643-1458(+)
MTHALIHPQTLIQPVYHRHHAVETPEALEQLIDAILGILLLAQLHTHCAPRGDVCTGPIQHNLHIHQGLPIKPHLPSHNHEQPAERIKMIVRDIHIVVDRPEVLVVVLLGATELSANVLVHLASDLPLLGLGLLEVEPHSVILHSLVIHTLHRGLQVHVPAKPLQQALTVAHQHRIHRSSRLLQHLRSDGLDGHHHFVDEVVRVACAEERAGEIGDQGIEMVVVNVQVTMDLTEGPPLVGLGPSQELHQEDGRPSLHLLQAVANQLLDALI